MIVADTNLLVYLTIQSEYTRFALAWNERDAEWKVPRLWRYEFAATMQKHVLSGDISLEQATQNITRVMAKLEPHEVEVDQAAVLELAIEHRISLYDANFILLAKQLSTRCVTHDKKLWERARGFTIPLDWAE